MNATSAQFPKQYRLARHYLDKLRAANRAYTRGDENMTYGLKLVRQDWAQIQQWQAWSVIQANQQREAAALCSAYPYEAGELLDLLLSFDEHRVWRESALEAARQEGSQLAELAHTLALSEIYDNLSQHTASYDAAQRALQLAERLGDQRGIAQALFQLGQCMFTGADFAQAKIYLEDSLTRFRALSDFRNTARTLYLLGRLAFIAHDLDLCRAHLQEALRLFQHSGDQRGTVTVLQLLPVYTLDRDDQAGEMDDEERLRLLEQSGDRVGVVQLLNLFATSRMIDGDLEGSLQYDLRRLELSRQLGMPRMIAHSLLGIGICYLLMERFAEADRYFMEAVEVCRRFDLRAMRSHVLALLAFNDFGLGDAGSMPARLREGLPIAYALTYEPALTLSILAVGAYRILMGDPQGAAGLVGMVDAYPGTHEDVRALAIPPLRQRLRQDLDPAVFDAAVERGADLDFDATVTALIADLTK